MAAAERDRNLWAVRFLYRQIVAGGLCLRPPVPLIDHLGHEPTATNCAGDTSWAVPLAASAPAITAWPEPVENPQCAALWRKAALGESKPAPLQSWPSRLRSRLRRILQRKNSP
jgi:hypothetical protein